MKIAVPSHDRQTVFGHFGRTPGFLIFETEGKNVVNQVYVENDFTGHALGQHHSHEHEHQHHSHGGILEALADVSVVIAGGMGRRLYDDLTGAGKQVYVSRVINAREAVDLYLEGSLDSHPGGCCSH